MRRPAEADVQAQLQLARARLSRSGAQVRAAVEGRLDVRGAVARRAWVLLACAFAVGFWVGRGHDGQDRGRHGAGD